MNNEKEAIYKSRIKLFKITALIHSVIVLIFILIFHKDLVVVIILTLAIGVIWLIALLKITSMKKAIKALKEQQNHK